MVRPASLAHAAGMVVLLLAVPAFGSALPAVGFGAAAVAVLFVTGRPRGGRLGVGVANLLTLVRVALVVLGAAGSRPLALAAFALAWALDAVDGAVARRLGEASVFGARFDLETDALSVAALSATLVARGEVGSWILGAGLLRYLLVLARGVFPEEAPGERRSRFGRAVYSATVVSLLCGFLGLPGRWSSGLAAAGLLLLCLSFSQDFLALRPRRGGRPWPLGDSDR